MQATEPQVKRPRLMSLDALRGFDMFWILGGEKLFMALFALTGWSFWQMADTQMHHSQWHGFTFYDLIFPLFIFLSGVALGLSPKRLDTMAAAERIPVYRHAFKRLLLLLALGVLYNHGWGSGIPAHPDEVRYASVLGRIAFAWFFAAMLVWHTGLKTQLLVAIALLGGYGAMHLWLPFPGGAAGQLTPEHSINAWIDGQFLPGITYQHKAYDPEGILSTIPAIVNALAGVMTGRFIVSNGSQGDWGKLATLAGAGGLMLALGWALDPLLPVNKDLWTSSFVLVTTGWSLLLLAIFYGLVDVLGARRLAFPFVVIGANSIIIYLASSLMNWDYLSQSLFGGMINALPEPARLLGAAMGFLTVQWVLLLWMYRKGIFIRI
ncbi:transmembrane glucosamine N-acetyltransferase NagX [Shewanella cyperi]|uniref:transmembrane glucosamine N-acetyltransferase NagX n=1 Tax=Shewanella cyperi TaxID=2814292 RepID=UPI001A93B7FC|nr:DUF5009 domain-containing protein [Shewanella cyperi]QSX41663.1 DUF5009 domain-containing protein [Shewanella cyperi]